MKQIICLLSALALLPLSAPAFSSAENAAQHQPAQHLGYLAFAKEGQLDALRAISRPGGAERALTEAGIQGLQTFSGTLDGRTVLFARNVTPNGTSVHAAWQKAMANKRLAPWFAEQARLIEPHPRAAAQGLSWLPLEQVFYFRGADGRAPGQQARACCAVTGLKPEMEMQYRTLHQTTWPGVLATIAKANIANFSIYLVEIGEQLYLFYYFDYVGDDFAKDMAGVGEDPVTRRWWKHTDACQLPLPEAAEKKQIWTDLMPVAPAPVP